MSFTPVAYTLDAVIARLRELATNGRAPGVRTWNEQRGPDLPSTNTLTRHGHNWLDLCQMAGLEHARHGGAPGISHASRAAFAAADAEVRHRLATAEPPRPNSWPLFGIPTRTEVKFGQLPDGTPVRVTRQYFSLR